MKPGTQKQEASLDWESPVPLEGRTRSGRQSLDRHTDEEPDEDHRHEHPDERHGLPHFLFQVVFQTIFGGHAHFIPRSMSQDTSRGEPWPATSSRYSRTLTPRRRAACPGSSGSRRSPEPPFPPRATGDRPFHSPVPLGLLVQVVVIAVEDHLPRELAGKFSRTTLLHDGKATSDRPPPPVCGRPQASWGASPQRPHRWCVVHIPLMMAELSS
jgi:hypothetical protein